MTNLLASMVRREVLAAALQPSLNHSVPIPNSAPLERFSRFVTFEPNSGCWLWVGAYSGPMKYGRFQVRHAFAAAQLYAHRMSYLLFKGDIPEGWFVCHRCDVPNCVNPDHLFCGPPQDNHRDMIRKARSGHQRNPAAWREYGRINGRKFEAGAKHPSAKLTEREVRAIRFLEHRGVYQVDLADAFGVDSATINGIVSGRNWSST